MFPLVGSEVEFLDVSLPAPAAAEIRWAWDSLRAASAARSLVVFKKASGRGRAA